MHTFSVVVLILFNFLLLLQTHGRFYVRPGHNAIRFLGPPFLIRGALRHELILKLPHKALHWPCTSFAEGADRASTGDIVGDLDQIIRILASAFAVAEPMERLGHPKRALP